VALAEAALEEAKINLGYTEVTAPITGVIGAALVTEGALVSADGSQNLALIQQIDPVYADFTQSSGELLALKRALETGDLESPEPGKARVQLVFDDGSVYSETGTLLFSGATVDSTTGQVTLRGEFPNPKGDLLPGLYVRVRIEQAVRQDALSVPQRAVIRTAEGAAQVYVVAADGTAELRPVTLGQSMDASWLVESGLSAGDRVVVEGSQKLQPGAKVATEEWKTASAPEAAKEQSAVIAQ
jgi:membrane fusion protein (multidrug efflux system)